MSKSSQGHICSHLFLFVCWVFFIGFGTLCINKWRNSEQSYFAPERIHISFCWIGRAGQSRTTHRVFTKSPSPHYVLSFFFKFLQHFKIVKHYVTFPSSFLFSFSAAFFVYFKNWMPKGGGKKKSQYFCLTSSCFSFSDLCLSSFPATVALNTTSSPKTYEIAESIACFLSS